LISRSFFCCWLPFGSGDFVDSCLVQQKWYRAGQNEDSATSSRGCEGVKITNASSIVSLSRFLYIPESHFIPRSQGCRHSGESGVGQESGNKE
jgi:hypothetical protein